MAQLKSATFAEKLNLKEMYKEDEKAGVIVFNDDTYEKSLEEVGLTLDQVKKLHKHDAAIIPAATLVAGEKAVEMFKANPELTEVSYELTAGHNVHRGYFNRDATTKVRNVVETHGMGDKGELHKVQKQISGLMADINS